MKLLLAAALAIGSGLVVSTPAAARSPALALGCGAPVHGVVTCHLSGRGFHVREHLYVFYEVVISAGGTTTARMYSRVAQTTPAGSFQRPPLRFSGDHHGLFSYRVTGIVVGARGDQASTQAVGQP